MPPGVAAEGAFGEHGRAGVAHAAALSGPAVEGAVAARRELPAEGAIGQRGRTAVVHAAALVGPPKLLTPKAVALFVPLPPAAELPLTVQSVSVAVPPSLSRPPPERHRRRGPRAQGAPPAAQLPLRVQSVSVAVPPLYRPPP